MKKIILQLFTALLLLNTAGKSQDLDLKWSEKMVYDNKKDGFFKDFIDNNSKYVYAEFANLALNPKKAEKKMKIVAYEKETMKKMAEVNIRGFKENKLSDKNYVGLRYEKTLVFEKVLYVFWIKEDKKKEELYVESYDVNLKKITTLKKIYEIANSDSRRARNQQSIVIMGNKKAGEKVLIGGELPAEAEKNIKFEYKLLNSDLTFSTASQIELPIKLKGKNYGLTSDYEYGDDGKLYIRSLVSMNKEERKNAQKGESTSYSIFSVVDLVSAKLTPFTFKFDGKNIFNIGYTVTNKGVKVYGFFCDLSKDPKGNDMHGIFYSILDSKSMSMTATNFTYFDKATLDKLFARDKEDQKKGGGLFKSKAAKKSDDESLADSYIIEDVKVEGDNIVLFCSKMFNWTTTTCDSKGNCRTNYYCTRSNITVFKINKEGSLIWASNLDRSMTYDGWFIYDVRVISKGDKYYVIYGSSYDATSDKKNRKSRKSLSERRDQFEYGVFENSTGNYKKVDFVVNAKGIEKKGRKYVDPRKIEVIDNLFYVNSVRVTYKLEYCLPSIVCWPLGYYTMLSGDTRRGAGNLGVIKPLK